MRDREKEVEHEAHTETTFGIPILDAIQNFNMKTFPYLHYLSFMEKLLNIQILFSSNSTYYVEVITTSMTPKN